MRFARFDGVHRRVVADLSKDMRASLPEKVDTCMVMHFDHAKLGEKLEPTFGDIGHGYPHLKNVYLCWVNYPTHAEQAMVIGFVKGWTIAKGIPVEFLER